jgi:hypothetical protein
VTRGTADTAILSPNADSTINDRNPDYNMGGHLTIDAGASGMADKKRALLMFNIAGQIPPQATVSSVTLTVKMVRAPNGGGVDSIFSLHRLRQFWGEGNKATADDNTTDFGEQATTNEVTWNARLYSAPLWSAPGTSSPVDYFSAASATNFIAGVGTYTFNSNSNLIADVQAWVNNPDTNFGWILTSLLENTSTTIRRFGSRESTNGPLLTVQYSLPAARPILTPLSIQANRFRFSFDAATNRIYTVDHRGALPGTNWTALTNIGPLAVATNVIVSDVLTSSNRFYRVSTP